MTQRQVVKLASTFERFCLYRLKTSLRLEILSIIEKDINFENLKAFNAWRRIIVEEGVTALWTGCRPTVARAMLVNACQLSFNTQAKYQLKKFSIGTFKSNFFEEISPF